MIARLERGVGSGGRGGMKEKVGIRRERREREKKNANRGVK